MDGKDRARDELARAGRRIEQVEPMHPWPPPPAMRTGEDDERTSLSGAAASALKQELNRLVWTYAPGGLTLAQADALACGMLDLFDKAFELAAARREGD